METAHRGIPRFACYTPPYARGIFMHTDRKDFSRVVPSLGLLFACAVILSCATGTDPKDAANATPSSTPAATPDFSWDKIPDSYLSTVKSLDVYFEHASVGSNVVSGLDALSSSDSRFAYTKGSWGNETIDGSVAAWYQANAGFGDNARGNPGFKAKVDGFVSNLSGQDLGSSVNVASFKFCYIDDDFSGFSDAQSAFDAVKSAMASLETKYPLVTFVWWTMPITTLGNASRDAYNTLVRSYCAANGKYLIDIASIECHDPSGAKKTDANGYETLVSDYTSDGGHLNDAGALLVAKAWWVTLAKIAGWKGA